MKPIVQILKSKPDPTVHAIAPDASVQEAASRMAQHNIGALLVREGEQVVGIVTERDIARRVATADRPVKQMTVREIMHAPVQYVPPSQTNEECMALMTEARLRHLPVIDDGRLVGLVSIGDLVKDIISEQEFIIHQLEHYIAGDRS